MMKYRDTMNNYNLIDLGCFGSKFTWFNKRRINPIYERLDRVLANSDWIDIFPECCAKNFPRMSSDHNPVLLLLNNSPTSFAKSFRFEPMWLTEPGFNQWLSSKWASYQDSLPGKLTL